MPYAAAAKPAARQASASEKAGGGVAVGIIARGFAIAAAMAAAVAANWPRWRRRRQRCSRCQWINISHGKVTENGNVAHCSYGLLARQRSCWYA